MKQFANGRALLLVMVMLFVALIAVGSVYGQNMNSGLVIPDAQIQQVEVAALQGSKEAARRLVNHYDYGVGDHVQALYWAEIAAENGDPVAEFNYGTLLRLKTDQMSQVRARFWYLRAEQSGLKHILPADKRFMESSQ